MNRPGIFVLEQTFPFSGGRKGEGQEAELVVVFSGRRKPVAHGWLNGEEVLVPSAVLRSKGDEVRVPVTLSDQNVLEFRLSGRPGNNVVFWIEGPAVPKPEPQDPSLPTIEFRVSGSSVGPTAVMNEVCAADFGEDFQIADWADVGAGVDATPVFSAGTAWIQWDGLGSFSSSFFGPTYHYLVSAIGNINPNYYYGTFGAEPNQLWLNAWDGTRPVLCKGPGS